jgi:hypothetical protein
MVGSAVPRSRRHGQLHFLDQRGIVFCRLVAVDPLRDRAPYEHIFGRRFHHGGSFAKIARAHPGVKLSELEDDRHAVVNFGCEFVGLSDDHRA